MLIAIVSEQISVNEKINDVKKASEEIYKKNEIRNFLEFLKLHIYLADCPQQYKSCFQRRDSRNSVS